MNVAPSAGGSAGLDPQTLSALAKAVIQVPVEAGTETPRVPTAVFTQDHFLPSLPELAQPAIQELLRVVEERVFPTESLRASESLPVQIPLQSSHAHAYAVQTPGQSPDVLLVDARESAVRSVGKAAHAVEMAEGRGARVTDRIPDGVDPRIVLALANQFIETSQLANYLRAEELGRLVSVWFEGAQPLPFVVGRSSGPVEAVHERQSLHTLRRLWTRAPLLVLFAAWLLSGLLTALLLRLMGIRAWENPVILDVWAVGFLALVVFQFVATIRGALRMRTR